MILNDNIMRPKYNYIRLCHLIVTINFKSFTHNINQQIFYVSLIRSIRSRVQYI
jgi:hypothetical protein